MQNNRTRKLNNNELREVVLHEQTIKKQVRDMDEQYIPKQEINPEWRELQRKDTNERRFEIKKDIKNMKTGYYLIKYLINLFQPFKEYQYYGFLQSSTNDGEVVMSLIRFNESDIGRIYSEGSIRYGMLPLLIKI